MALVFNAKTYNLDSNGVSNYDYAGSLNTATVKDIVRVSRVKPKPTSLFSGVGRTTFKLTRTTALTAALTPTSEIIVTVDVTVPVGYTAADVDASLNDVGAYLSSATAKTMAKNLQISF